MNILGVELEFDLLDADNIEIYEREMKRVNDDMKDPQHYENKSNADGIRFQCKTVDRFFDSVFGNGTAQKLFKGKANLRDHMEAFGQIAQAAQDSRNEIQAIEDKYTPNRAERRQKERNNRGRQKQNSRNFQQHAAGVGKKHNNH